MRAHQGACGVRVNLPPFLKPPFQPPHQQAACALTWSNLGFMAFTHQAPFHTQAKKMPWPLSHTSCAGGVHFDLVKRVIRDIQRSGQGPEEIIQQITDTVYPMYKVGGGGTVLVLCSCVAVWVLVAVWESGKGEARRWGSCSAAFAVRPLQCGLVPPHTQICTGLH